MNSNTAKDLELFNEKKAVATLDSLRRIFTVPEDQTTTLGKIEANISKNLAEFLRAHIVTIEKSPNQLEQDFLDTRIPEEPLFVSDQAQFLLEKVVAQSVHTASPAFVGHMTSALPYFMLPLTKIMIALNQNQVKIETAKAFTPLEKQVLGMLHRLIYDFSDEFYAEHTHNKSLALGSFCSGGTIANITALWVARNKLLAARGTFEGVSKDGLWAGMAEYGYSGLAILVSRRGHYSLLKSADLLGIGKKNLVSIETTAHNKINISALLSGIRTLKEKNIKILSLIGIAGTTETGNVDPLDDLAKIAEDEACHFHVDAAWGGPTLFSNRYRNLLRGIEKADTVTIDGHKQLYVPMGSGMVLYRDPTSVKSIEQNANYIIRKGSRDLGKHTLEGSRPGMALLIHSGLRCIGRKGYELLVDLGVGKAKQFANAIQETNDFELITEPELNILTYRYVPPELKEKLQNATPEEVRNINSFLNKLTVSIQKRQRAAGQTFVSRTTLDPVKYNHELIVVFRVVLANPLTTRQVLSRILEEQREIAIGLLEGPRKF
jgi:glutamate decarboxylase